MVLRNCSGQMWNNSPASKYLENLPIANAEGSSVTDTRYLLPRENVFTFGFQNGITNPVIYFSCKLCQLLIKIHELKNHMLSKHPNLETTVGSTTQSSPPQPGGGTKSKKNSHKSKKKVVPPPNVPPPPLFSNIEMLNPVNTVPALENLLPPVLQPVETVKENNSTFTMEVETIPNVSPPTLSTQIAAPRIIRVPAVSILKPKEERLQLHKHKKSKKKKSDYNPDKHCGVLDSSKQPCLRTITCANHSIMERRAVRGRTTSLDSLIANYKSVKVKPKVHCIPTIPISIAPKHCSTVKEVKNGYRYVEVIYDKKNDSPKINPAEESNASLPAEGNFLPKSHCIISVPKRENSVLKTIKLADSTNARNVPQSLLLATNNTEMELMTAKSKTTNGKLIKLRLIPSNSTLAIPKLADSSTPLTPTLYSLHPKPMTMLTGALRRVGSSIVLQNSSRLERQRMDLQAVVNQHKQLKISVANKAVLLLNSNHTKQSILKNNVKNNTKANLKRMALDKTNINEFKHMKVIAADLNGILLNANFSESNEIQNSDKISLLK